MSKVKSYHENYNRLKTIEKEISQTEEIDIDEMLELVKESSLIYKTCKTRIQKVQKEIQKITDDMEEN